jgi:hypothetical protein
MAQCASVSVLLLFLLHAGVFDALAAAVEFCNPNKCLAREGGGVDVTSELLLMLSEVGGNGVGGTRVRACVRRGTGAGVRVRAPGMTVPGVRVPGMTSECADVDLPSELLLLLCCWPCRCLMCLTCCLSCASNLRCQPAVALWWHWLRIVRRTRLPS